MAMKIRLARGGSKKRPHYSIVAADSRSARDGRFIEKLGTYDPLLPKDNEGRVKIDLERVQYWLGQGAQATDRVQRFLEAAGVAEKKSRANPKRGQPGKAALERAKARADKAAAPPRRRRSNAAGAPDAYPSPPRAGRGWLSRPHLRRRHRRRLRRARRGAAEVVLRRARRDRRLRPARHRGRPQLRRPNSPARSRAPSRRG